MKLTTGKQAVQVASEVLECFGGAGYVEDTGLPMLLRDSQVLPIWEGTTNVLALDTLRALGPDDSVLDYLIQETKNRLERIEDAPLADAARVVTISLDHAKSWLTKARKLGRSTTEAGARRFALTLGRATELSLLIQHANWSKTYLKDERSAMAAWRFAQSGVDGTWDIDEENLAWVL